MHKGRTVFLADDDQDDRNMMKEALQEADPDVCVIEAENGLQLLSNIHNAQDLSASIVIVDMSMPAMNGLELIQSLKDDLRFSNLTTIMMTTSNDTGLKINAIRSGANGFITKPVSIPALAIVAKDIFKYFFVPKTV
jgi:CheY-like chemotaxis protein